MSFLRAKERDKETQDTIYQISRGQLKDIIKEKERWNKILASILAGSVIGNAVLGGGAVYLGTLPKRVVETRMLDPLGMPMHVVSKAISDSSQVQSLKSNQIILYLRYVRETYPGRKDLQEEAVRFSGRMTIPNSPAWEKGDAYFEKHKPYERAKTEAVSLSNFFVTESRPDFWVVEFIETVRNVITGQVVSQQKYVGRLFTQTKEDRQSLLLSPLGIFVQDYDIDHDPSKPR